MADDKYRLMLVKLITLRERELELRDEFLAWKQLYSHSRLSTAQGSPATSPIVDPEHVWPSWLPGPTPHEIPEEFKMIAYDRFCKGIVPKYLICGVIKRKPFEAFVDSAPEYLKAIVFALGFWHLSVRSPSVKPPSQAERKPIHTSCAEKARQLLLAVVDQPSVDVAQTLILMAYYGQMTDSFKLQVHCTAEACRMANYLYSQKTALVQQGELGREASESIRRIVYHCHVLQCRVTGMPFMPFAHSHELRFDALPPYESPENEAAWSYEERPMFAPNAVGPNLSVDILFLQKIHGHAVKYLRLYNDGPIECDPNANQQAQLKAEYIVFKDQASQSLWRWYASLPDWIREVVNLQQLSSLNRVSNVMDLVSLNMLFYSTLLAVHYPAMIEELWYRPQDPTATLPNYMICQQLRSSVENMIYLSCAIDSSLTSFNMGISYPYFFIASMTFYILCKAEPETDVPRLLGNASMRIIVETEHAGIVYEGEAAIPRFIEHISKFISITQLCEIRKLKYSIFSDIHQRVLCRVPQPYPSNLSELVRQYRRSHDPPDHEMSFTALGPWLPISYLESNSVSAATELSTGMFANSPPSASTDLLWSLAWIYY
ncbi:uncharacterized protein BJ171DRAFT_492300 [Polychytrium aggregatum]|uniref:uncharacterized protein n=1 Tax=Polychytrium aggregatum TaxID=110093 RepID=UPI0022FEF363|nr:uncharacterized protein BJ171DRAFT_492300 [Polychytrium aggregatum]KAI9207987.1 hypothetical protein BJ171DRAFT_492300 [Polychytrium aggregatum]